MNSDFMTTKEAGKLLNVSPKTITRWIDTGKLDGKRTMFGRVALRASVTKLLETKEEAPAETGA